MEALLLLRRRQLVLIKLKRRRTIWIREMNKNRESQGDFHNLVQELRLKDVDGFFNYMRMTPDTFDYLLSIVGNSLQRKHSNFRQPLSSAEKLSMTLRFLASGDSMTSTAYSYRVGLSTVSTVIRETCNLIWDHLQPIYLPAPNEEMWKRNMKLYDSLWNFPNCVGAIDGKHVIIQSPQKSGSLFFNYKNTYSIVLLAVCDPTYCYTYVDIGAYGKNSDGSVFAHSDFGKRLDANQLLLPADKPLPGTNRPIPAAFVADEAFPLKRNLLRPYPGRKLDYEKRVFNYRLSRARRVVENVFGITASRWRILRKPIISSTETATAIVKAVVCLHNFISRYEQRSSVYKQFYLSKEIIDNDKDGAFHPGEWRKDVSLSSFQNIGRLSTNTHAKEAAEIRDTIKDFFQGEIGEVPWQNEIVNRGYTED